MTEQNIDFKFAPLWKRGAAFIVDMALVVTLFCLLIHTVNILLALPVELAPIFERGIALKMSPYVEEHFIEIVILYSSLKLAVLVPYFTLLESSRLQATFGKLLLGIKVIDLSGKRISFARATGRFFAKVFSGQVLLIGYFMAAFSKRKQALHDLLAATLVVTKEGIVSVKTRPTNGREGKITTLL
jgi:uncharacterized RDD family membrane protein YckC